MKHETQVALWADLWRCCYYNGGLNTLAPDTNESEYP